MPLDPTISLGVRVPQPEPPQPLFGQINPFSAAEEMARTQQLQNENQKFQLQQKAYAIGGSIMSQHPGDMEGAIRDMTSSPIGPYLSDVVRTLRESNQALAQTDLAITNTNAKKQEIYNTSMEGFAHSLPLILGGVNRGDSDDKLYDIANDIRRRTLLGTPENQRDQVDRAMGSAFDAVFQNNPPVGDPNRIATIKQKLGALMIGAHFSGEDWKQTVGEPRQIDLGWGFGQGYDMPISLGGGWMPALGADGNPQVIPKGIAPGFYEPGRLEKPGSRNIMPPAGVQPSFGQPGYFGVGGAPRPPVPMQMPAGPAPTLIPGGAAPGGAAPPIGATPPAGGPEDRLVAGGAAPVGAVPIPPAGGGAQFGSFQPEYTLTGPDPAATYLTPPASRMAGDGRPLWDHTVNWTAIAHRGSIGTGGQWIPDPVEKQQIDRTTNVWSDAGQREYEGANRGIAQLQFIETGLDNLVGTKLESGAFGERSLEMAKGWNALLQRARAFGIDVPQTAFFDPNQIASAEDVMKAGRLLQFSTVTQQFGAQREAAQTIQAAANAVPGMQNSYLGNKLIIESLRTMIHRAQDLREFQEQWLADPRTRGNLTGSDIEFNKMHPPDDYAKEVLDKFGMTKDGFKTAADVTRAVDNGWILPNEHNYDKFRTPKKETQAAPAPTQAAPTQAPTMAPNQLTPPSTPPSTPPAAGPGFNPISTLFPFR